MSVVFGWAVCRPIDWKNGPGGPQIFTVARTRGDAIAAFLTLWGDDYNWKRLYRKGWRARHVEVRAILFGAAQP